MVTYIQYVMKSILLVFVFILNLFQLVNAQVITCVPCDQLGMVMNVGSQETSISIYHSGQYMTHPQSENIFMWKFTDQQGNILHQDTIVDQQTIAFSHNWPLTDTINVVVHFVNDSANLENWYINQGLPINSNSINCLFEDQLYWDIDTFSSGTSYGTWTFIQNNTGIDLNTATAINDFVVEIKKLIKIVDFLGRQHNGLNKQPLLYIYDDGTVEKKMIFK